VGRPAVKPGIPSSTVLERWTYLGHLGEFGVGAGRVTFRPSASPYQPNSPAWLNEVDQHSLRPALAEVPAECRVVYGEADRAAWLDYAPRLGCIEQNWLDVGRRAWGLAGDRSGFDQ
jgi:uncharacterized protein YbdZ (MbtH family)